MSFQYMVMSNTYFIIHLLFWLPHCQCHRNKTFQSGPTSGLWGKSQNGRDLSDCLWTSSAFYREANWGTEMKVACFLEPREEEIAFPIWDLFLLPSAYAILQSLQMTCEPPIFRVLVPIILPCTCYLSARNPSLHIVQLAISSLSIQFSSSPHSPSSRFWQETQLVYLLPHLFNVNQLHFLPVSQIVTFSCLEPPMASWHTGDETTTPCSSCKVPQNLALPPYLTSCHSHPPRTHCAPSTLAFLLLLVHSRSCWSPWGFCTCCSSLDLLSSDPRRGKSLSFRSQTNFTASESSHHHRIIIPSPHAGYFSDNISNYLKALCLCI